MVSCAAFSPTICAASLQPTKFILQRELAVSINQRLTNVGCRTKRDLRTARRCHERSVVSTRSERHVRPVLKVVLQASSGPAATGGEGSSASESVFEGELSVLEGGMTVPLSSLPYDTAGTSSGAVVGHTPKLVWFAKSEAEEWQILDRGINGAIVGFSVAAAVAKLCTVDHDYWAGWTLYEILRNAPGHNWLAYEAMLSTNPIFAKMCISGVVYAVGDLSAQCYEGRPFLEFDRTRVVRSGLVGFLLHGSLSHHYYHFCEWLFPFKEWWVVPVKVAFDQTVWSGVWNSIYFIALGLLRFENPVTIFKELKPIFFPLLTAGWKLWPFAHIVTYGVMPVEQRLLWVDMVELVWVTILSMIVNETAETKKGDLEEGQVVVVGDGAEVVMDVVDSLKKKEE